LSAGSSTDATLCCSAPACVWTAGWPCFAFFGARSSTTGDDGDDDDATATDGGDDAAATGDSVAAAAAACCDDDDATATSTPDNADVTASCSDGGGSSDRLSRWFGNPSTCGGSGGGEGVAANASVRPDLRQHSCRTDRTSVSKIRGS
jgi:hypothetical protein